MIFLNIKLAFRNLIRNKVYSFLIIGGFAIGFTACILIGLFYHSETTVNNSFNNHEQIYRIYDVKINRCNLNWNLYPVLTSDYAAVEDACPLDYNNFEQLTIRDEQTSSTAVIRDLVATTGNFFSIFSVELIESSSGNPFEGKESASVSSTLASSLFGTQNPLGRQINIGNYFFATVTSVFNELPVNSSFRADIILNSENEKFRFSSTISNGKKYNPTNHFVMLRAGASPGDFVNELNKSSSLSSLDIDSMALQRLDDIYLSELTVKSRHAKGNPTLLRIFLAVASLILFLSSINYLNYSVSIQYAKLRDSGIKKTFGADRINLIMYAIVEVTFGIIISLFIAVFLTDLALSHSEIFFGKAMNINLQDWLAVAPFFMAVLIAVIFLNSIVPIYFLSKFTITEFLSGFSQKRKHIWKNVFLTFQLTTSTALIAVVMIIFKQLHFVNHSDPGFNRDLLLRINIPYHFPHTNAFNLEIGKLSFVKNTTMSAGCPGMINHKYGSNTGENSFDINCIHVGDNYLNTMGIELIEGRNFLSGDLNKSCLINEEALKQFGWESYEGNRFNNGQEGGFVLTCMGILGQIFMICLTRVKEVGIRKINGAKVSEILVMLNRDFMKMVAIALIAATPVSALIMHKWLENFTYKTNLSWWVFVLAGVLALFITLITVSWQSWRAATRNPVEALRYE